MYFMCSLYANESIKKVRKSKTINKYLGNNYTVLASYGHIRDLPQKRICGS